MCRIPSYQVPRKTKKKNSVKLDLFQTRSPYDFRCSIPAKRDVTSARLRLERRSQMASPMCLIRGRTEGLASWPEPEHITTCFHATLAGEGFLV